MFNKHKQFFFKEPLQKQNSESLFKEYSHNVQVILCGTYAKNVISAIDKELDYNVDKDLYAFQYCAKGKLRIEATVDVRSEVDYQETRKKKKKDCSFQHEDRILKSGFKSDMPSHSYEKCDPDLKSNVETYLVVAAKDQEEIDSKLEELHTKIGNHKITKCMVMFENGGSVSWKVGLSNWPIYFCGVTQKNPSKGFAESIKEELEKNTENYIKSLEQELYDNLSKNIVKEFETIVHEKADEFFNAHKQKCSIM